MFKRGLLREYSAFLAFAMRLFDLLLVLGAGVAAYRYKFGSLAVGEPYQLVLMLGVLLAAVILPLFGLYRSWRGRSLWQQLWRLSLAWGSVAVILAMLAFGTKTGARYSREWAGVWVASGWLLLVGSRVGMRLLFNRFRASGWNRRHILVVGAGDLGRNVARQLREAGWAGYEVVAFLDDAPALQGTRVDGIGVEAIEAGLERHLARRGVDEVWLALPLRAERRLREVQHLLRHSTVPVRFVPDIFGFSLLNHGLSEVAGIPLIDLSVTPMEGANRIIKAVEDRVLALLILLLVSPLMLLLAAGVKLSSPGPVFHRQKRVGWNGRVFEMLKFRSMPVDAERGGVRWGGARHKPVTPFGRFLRRTGLDELPQFINVLRGEMSIVGPRPERPMFVERFKEEIPGYMKKHMVKAGITGWAQVNGWRGDTDLRKRIEYDLFYIENWSLGFDLKIIFMTLLRGFSGGE